MEAATTKQPAALRAAAHTISFIFHPLFIPSLLAAFIIYKDPYAFAAYDNHNKLLRLLMVVLNTAFLPMFSVALMKQLGFIQSIFLRTQRDRIIPYIVCMIFYFWAWYVAKNKIEHPFFVAMLLAVFLSSIGGMMANIYYKVSMHGIAMGALFVLFFWMAQAGSAVALVYFPAVIFSIGLVCTARFIVSDHSNFEIYSGLMLGALCQSIAILVTA